MNFGTGFLVDNPTFNRTIVELKLSFSNTSCRMVSSTFNRTIVELKQANPYQPETDYADF